MLILFKIYINSNVRSNKKKKMNINPDDHKREEYCYNRLVYRNGKKPTAVKVKFLAR